MNAHNLLRDSFPAARELVIDDPLAALSPSQQAVLAEIERLSAASPIVGITGPSGLGKSTIIRALLQKYRAEVVTAADYVEQMRLVDPHVMNNQGYPVICAALDRADFVVLPDSQILRGSLHPMHLRALHLRILREGKRLICCDDEGHLRSIFGSFGNGARIVTTAQYEAVDYATIVGNIVGVGRVDGVDFGLVHRHAPMLTGYDLRLLCNFLPAGTVSTEAVLAILGEHVLRSNVRIAEVEELTFEGLPGAEHIAAKLETHIVLPMENVELARRLDIRPKRGVLLYGPPGTGKTSIGRALAHRMKGKFFLIDGSVTTEPPLAFFNAVRGIVSEAQSNAPSVLFIDDADVLFGIDHIAGFSRYLLSLLDGMESETAGKVCLMMTAMDASKVPAAILRSGRVELWLETRPPSAQVRAAILKRWMTGKVPRSEALNYEVVAGRAASFTPADLRRVVADAMAFLAADRVLNRPAIAFEAHLLRAIDEIRASRSRMADNLGDDSLRLNDNLATGKYATSIGGLAEVNSSCAVTGW